MTLAFAAMNHPNICQIYDVGPDYIVMELVADGKKFLIAAPARVSGSAACSSQPFHVVMNWTEMLKR